MVLLLHRDTSSGHAGCLGHQTRRHLWRRDRRLRSGDDVRRCPSRVRGRPDQGRLRIERATGGARGGNLQVPQPVWPPHRQQTFRLLLPSAELEAKNGHAGIRWTHQTVRVRCRRLPVGSKFLSTGCSRRSFERHAADPRDRLDPAHSPEAWRQVSTSYRLPSSEIARGASACLQVCRPPAVGWAVPDKAFLAFSGKDQRGVGGSGRPQLQLVSYPPLSQWQ
mmetsp:Transcript_87408/g.182916  ORF Transcript_87408/g.182916 Transcript_87408/m.182916 type:complete len:222 (+) Transcript_87408:1374-2039(+)